MPKMTVKDLRKQVKGILEKHQKPTELNPVEELIKALKNNDTTT